MRQTKKLTLSALTVALGTVFMSIGAVVEALDLSAVALASVLMAFIYLELGSPYTWLVWLCTTLITFIIYPGSLLWLEYLLVFGIYPVVKGYIERLPRTVWLIIKLLYANITVAILALLGQFVLGVSLFGDTSDFFGLPKGAVYVALVLILNLAFVAYDIFINVMVRFYLQKLRPTFKRFLK